MEQQVAWMAVAHGPADRLVVLFDQVLDDFGSVRDVERFAHDLKEFAKRRFFGVEDFDFVGYPSEEGVVDEVFGFEVGAEDHELIEWDLDLLTTADADVVVAFFERDDPSVEQFVDAHSLAAEVVDEENAAVAFHLERCIADIRFGVARDLEHRHGQFTTGDDGRSSDADPALVDLGIAQESIGGLVGVFFVVEGIEDSHEVPIDVDRARNPDVVAKGARDTFGDAGFSISWVAVEEHTAAAVDGGTESREELRGDEKVGERFAKIFVRWVLVFNRLESDRLDVMGERDGGCTEVSCLEHVAACSIPAGVGEGVDVVIDGGGAEVATELLRFEFGEGWLDQPEGEFELIGDRTTRCFPTVEEVTHDQFFDRLAVQPRLLKRLGFEREKRFARVVGDFEEWVSFS